MSRGAIIFPFTVVFEEQRKRSGFLEKDSKEAKAISNILDKINS